MLMCSTGEGAEAGALSRSVQRERCNLAVKRAKDFLLNAPQSLDTERLKFLLETYSRYEGDPPILLRARLFENVLLNKKIFIDDNPLVGYVTSKPAGLYVYPEWNADWILKEMNQAMVSHLGAINMTAEEKALMREAALFFKDRCATARSHRLAQELYDYDLRPDVNAGLFTEGTGYTIGAGNVDYGTFVRKGLAAIIAETEARLRALPVTAENASKIDFYRATLISMRALIKLANRYADMADRMAGETDDAVREAELHDIARICRHVPEHAPRSFREAVQSWWFLHLGIQIEQAGCGSSPGRLGQYLEEFYQKDKAENGLMPEDAKAWFKCLFAKILEFGFYQGMAFFKHGSGHTGHTINVGGLTADGEDATGELDYLLLDVQIEMQNTQPSITVLYHDALREDFLLKCVDLDRTGLGQPQWMNNQVIMARLLARHARNGITLEDARKCINMSCVGVGVEGKTAFLRENATYNVCKCFELALYNGVDPMTGKQIGPATGDPAAFNSFEEFYQAFSRQIGHMHDKMRRYGNISNKALRDTVPTSFRSAMYGGCLERGKFEYDGGADYYLYFVISTAGVDAANSLAAVRTLVFDEKKLSMGELIKALDANFEGYEDIRELCLNAPKHGNNEPATNALVRRMYDDIWKQFHENGTSFFGDHIANPEAYSLSLHNYYGGLTGALPTGRKKGRPLTDGSVSAMPGTDKNGPLALITSAAQALDTVRYASNHFNMKFHPSAIKGVNGARKLLTLIKRYMDMGGSHIQFNVVGSDTLRQAKEMPQEHKTLTVRVAGFSAYFTRLDMGVQDEIIARTEMHSA